MIIPILEKTKLRFGDRRGNLSKLASRFVSKVQVLAATTCCSQLNHSDFVSSSVTCG